MSEQEIPLSKRDQLALAIARGKSVAGWARRNQVPAGTAYGWSRDRDLRRQVQDLEEDMMDALRGGIRDALPEVSASAPHFPQVHASRIF